MKKKKVHIGGIFADTDISATGSYRPIKSANRYIGRALVICVLPGDVVQRCHSEAGHYCPATLFGQKLMPYHLLGLVWTLSLKEDKEEE